MAKPAQTKTATKQDQAPLAGPAPTSNLPAVVEEANAFRREMEARRRALEPKLPPHIPWEKFQANIWSAIQSNPKLLECSKATLWNACAETAELGLSLNKSLREADILPVWDKKAIGDNGKEGTLVAQLRIRYGGYQKLARQSGIIVDIRASEVYEWDEFYHEEGLNPILRHVPGPKPAGYEKKPNWGVTHAYCVWEEVGGRKRFEVMDLEDLLRIMRRSPSYQKDKSLQDGKDIIYGPWQTDFTEQCKKTVMRRSSKWMPQSAEKNNVTAAYAKAMRLDDIREGGGRAELKDGDVLDVTDFAETSDAPAQPQQQSAAAKSQVDDLASRMAGKQQQGVPSTNIKQAGVGENTTNIKQGHPPVIDNPPQQQAQPKQEPQKQPAALSRLEVPRSNGAADWPTWLALSVAAVRELDEAQRAEWKTKHKDLLDNCEFNIPDQMDELMKILP